MKVSRLVTGSAVALIVAAGGAFATRAQTAGPLRFAISFPASRSAQPLDGRVLLFISDDGKAADADGSSAVTPRTRPRRSSADCADCAD